ncbi:hypothetical protein BH23BAC1_BH23BAC1_07530 [soil metagenome]
MSGSGYHSWEMSGMVSLVMGNNSWAGGNVKADNQQSFHIANSNLSIDQIPVVVNGKLQELIFSRK